jgi:N-acetylglucosamine-6-phosphate deacetylase
LLTLAPSRLFTGEAVLEGAAVSVRDGRIAKILAAPDANAVVIDGLLAPGFIDIQINGGGGALFNDAPTMETIQTIAQAHLPFGVTGFMATLVSDERAKMSAAIGAVTASVQAGLPGLLGLHLEGPWLADSRRGVHPARFLRPFDAEDLALLTQPPPFPLLITAAPEQIERGMLEALVAAGVLINLGHTAASAEDIEAAFDAGARGVTHLFNAMPPLESRKPGLVGAALAHEASWAGIILDGIHVHPLSARVAFACKTARRLILVSDSMATVGASASAMTLFGEPICVQGGALRTSDGTLAGAHLDLSAAVRNATTLLGASAPEALRMATLTPAEFLGVAHERGQIAPGRRADFVVLDDDLNVTGVWIGGERAV